jgi:hypothetical protein
MGKRIDDLPLNDTPIEIAVTPTATGADFRDSEVYRFQQEIDDLLARGSYTWAEETLTDISETVGRTGQVTEGQRRAVKNIEEGGQKTRRRYRNWGRNW